MTHAADTDYIGNPVPACGRRRYSALTVEPHRVTCKRCLEYGYGTIDTRLDTS